MTFVKWSTYVLILLYQHGDILICIIIHKMKVKCYNAVFEALLFKQQQT